MEDWAKIIRGVRKEKDWTQAELVRKMVELSGNI